jgi:hypothetical protein
MHQSKLVEIENSIEMIVEGGSRTPRNAR